MAATVMVGSISNMEAATMSGALQWKIANYPEAKLCGLFEVELGTLWPELDSGKVSPTQAGLGSTSFTSSTEPKLYLELKLNLNLLRNTVYKNESLQ